MANGSIVDESCDVSDGTNANGATITDNSSFLLSNADLKMIDSAIQMRLKMNRSLPRRLTFDDFYNLLRKTELASRSTSSSTSAANLEPLDQRGTILYEFLVLFIPSLYKIYQARNVLRDNSLSWFIESTFEGTNTARSDELGRCLRNRGSAVVDDDSIRQSIVDHQKEKETRRSLMEQSNRQSQDRLASIGDDQNATIIQPGMTLDERVRARASAKRARAEESKLEEHPEQDTHRGFLLQLAHGLWQHSNFILAKRQRIMSPIRKSASPSPLVLTLKDAIESLKTTLAAGNGKVLMKQGQPVSRRQLVAAFQELSQMAPDFITIAGDDNETGSSLSKNTTIWLNRSSFGSTRDKLVGRESKEATKPVAPAVSLMSHSRNPVVSNHLDAQTLVTKLSATLSKTAQSPFPLVSLATASDGNDIASSTPKETGTKREGCDDRDTNVASSHKKQKRGLRINHNLILSPADHVGGEIIDLGPMQQSPRGLKLLFDQMKAGQRI